MSTLLGFLILAAFASAQERVPQPDYRGHVLRSVPEPVAFRHRPGATYGAVNQMACRIAGVALAVKLFPDLPEAKAWSLGTQSAAA